MGAPSQFSYRPSPSSSPTVSSRRAVSIRCRRNGGDAGPSNHLTYYVPVHVYSNNTRMVHSVKRASTLFNQSCQICVLGRPPTILAKLEATSSLHQLYDLIPVLGGNHGKVLCWKGRRLNVGISMEERATIYSMRAIKLRPAPLAI